MDTRAATFFFLVLLIFQANPSAAVEYCIFTGARMLMCMQPTRGFGCMIDAATRHLKYKDSWCDDFFRGTCRCKLCRDTVD
uniref:Uncharacterized protein n=1 Tax=Oryza brachyantha TaxID=4533 RepID=J3N1W2_ORYBR